MSGSESPQSAALSQRRRLPPLFHPSPAVDEQLPSPRRRLGLWCRFPCIIVLLLDAEKQENVEVEEAEGEEEEGTDEEGEK